MIQLIFEIASFILFIAACLYIPGKYISQKLKLTLAAHEELFFATGFGLIIFTFLSYVFSWMGFPLAAVILLLVIDALAIKEKKFTPAKIEKKHIKPLLLVLVMCFVFSLYMLATGKFGDSIIVRHDDLWHLALMNEMKTNFPPDNPGFAGVPLRAYHFFNDFMGAKISNATFISIETLQFWFIPLLFSFLWGFGVYSLVYKWSGKITASLWAVFLTMFGGSLAFILNLQGHPGFSLASGLGIDQPFDALQNPPFAASIIILILIFFSIFEYLKTKNYYWLVPISLFVGIISMFKVYGGIIAIAIFGLLFLHEIAHKRFIIILAGIASGVIFLSTYWYFAAGAGHLVFLPLWAPHGVLRAFPWYGFDEKMYTYEKYNVIKGLITTEFDGLQIFILGNSGTRMIGILLLPLIFLKNRKPPSFFAFLVFVACLIGLAVPLFFIQTGQVFETIQLGWYFLFFASLLSALGFAAFFDLKFNKAIKAVLIILIVAATLPSAYGQFQELGPTRAQAQSLSGLAYSALNFLKSQGGYNQTVLEVPHEFVKPDDESIRVWYTKSSPIISAFANKRTFYNNEFNSFPGRNTKERVAVLADIIRFTQDPTGKAVPADVTLAALAKYDIRYIYSHFEVPGFSKIPRIKKVFQNGSETIYKVQE